MFFNICFAFKIKVMKSFITYSITIFLQLLATSLLQAQSDTIELKKFAPLDKFDLSKYNLPDLHYKFLVFSGNFNSGSNSDHKIKKEGSDNNYSEKTKNNSSIVNLTLNNYSYTNSRKEQININNQLFLDSRFVDVHKVYSYFNVDSNYHNNYLKMNFIFNSGYSKKTFRKNNFFIKKSVNFDLEIGNGETEKDKKSYFISINPGIGIGKGRIEDVTDIWHIIRILKEMHRIGKLLKIPDEVELLDLAKQISVIKYKRVLDYRLKNKYNLQMLDEILSKAGLIGNKNFDYYNSLIDTWYYGANTRRLSNWEVGIHLYPIFNLENLNLTLKENYRFTTGLGSDIYYKRYIPVNVFWQLNYGTSIGFRYLTLSANKFEHLFDGYSFYLSPSLYANVAFYLSSRTYISSGISAIYNQHIFNPAKFQNNSYIFDFNNNFNFYLSPNSKLSLVFSIWYHSSANEDNSFYNYFNKHSYYNQNINITFSHDFY